MRPDPLPAGYDLKQHQLHRILLRMYRSSEGTRAFARWSVRRTILTMRETETFRKHVHAIGI